MTERKQSEVRMREQNDELRRWHAITLGREERIQELKQEINQLLAQIGQPGRYDSVKSDRSTRQGSGQPADDRPLSDADAGETR